MSEDQNEILRLHATVEGRVQGVGFRYFVEENAVALELRGWVRNRWNGDVEVMAEGERQALNKLMAALYKGPRSAYVTNIEADWEPATGEFSYFRVRSTE